MNDSAGWSGSQSTSLVRYAAFKTACVPLFWMICLPTPAFASSLIELNLQKRDRESGRILASNESADPSRIGVVIIDMWNTNDCMTNAQRAGALVPRMNKALGAARRLGMSIIWAPTD